MLGLRNGECLGMGSWLLNFIDRNDEEILCFGFVCENEHLQVDLIGIHPFWLFRLRSVIETEKKEKFIQASKRFHLLVSHYSGQQKKKKKEKSCEKFIKFVSISQEQKGGHTTEVVEEVYFSGYNAEDRH